MEIVLFDSSVLVALFDRGDAHHSHATDLVHRFKAEERCISIVTYSEVLIGLLQADITHKTASSSLIKNFMIEPVSLQVADKASLLRHKHKSLKLPDALILATGIETKAKQIYTFDKTWQKIDARVEVPSL